MKKSKMPKTDSINELADFWDKHDVTDFEDELEEVGEPVFVRAGAIQIHLAPRELAEVKKQARATGVSHEELVHAWVLEHLAKSNGRGSKKRRATS